MAGFEKVILASGEPRGEYIQRRLKEGAAIKDITAEINAPGLFSGEPGKAWGESTVYAEKRKLDANQVIITDVAELTIKHPLMKQAKKPVQVATEEQADVAASLDAATVEVPPEFEGILDETDMAEIRVEAAEALRKKQRAQARKEALAKASQELEHEARLASERGTPKGDLVDVTIDLAPYAADIRLDGKAYLHGRTYRVNRKVHAVLTEQMQRSWQHQDGLSGKNDRPYRRSLADRGITANNAQQLAVRG